MRLHPGASSCSIAVADDDPTLRYLLTTMLTLEPGFEVVGEAADGHGAIQLVEGGNCPDVLLLDLNMPGMDGYAVLRKLRAQCPPLRIVVYSGENEAEGRRKVGGIGDFDYVVKGDPAKLIDHLRGLAADS